MAETLQPGMHVHVMGIGGFGMSAIARLMHEMGYVVSGCDLNETALLSPLQALGIAIEIGHDPAHLDTYAPDALIISSAIPADQAEIQQATARGIAVYKRADLLGALMTDDSYGIVVAGTHGKTTTTAMIAHLLSQLQMDPTFIVGGVPINLGINAHAGNGDLFVVEGDEYDRMFMGLKPKMIVLTSLEMDHPDMFSDLETMRGLFTEFLELLPEDGTLVANFDDPEVRVLADEVAERGIRVQGYGTSGEGEWMAMAALAQNNDIGGQDYRIFRNQSISNTTAISRTYQASLRLPGTHNMLNALAALVVAVEFEVKPKEALEIMSEFVGVERRFEIKGEAGGVLVIDDYAHHPTEIRATLQAARGIFGQRAIWAVWQPHTFSRTATLLEDFAASFSDANAVLITDVFRSRDVDDLGITPSSVLDIMTHPNAFHVSGGVEDVARFLIENVRDGDVVIVMSAGDATLVTDQLLAGLGG